MQPDQKTPRIEDLLALFPAEQRHLRLSIDRCAGGYVVRALLQLPTASLLARTRSPVADAGDAVDQVTAELANKIDLHLIRLASIDGGASPLPRAVRDLRAAEPHLIAMRAGQDRDGFFDVLRPLLRQLGGFPFEALAERVLELAWAEWYERPVAQPLDRRLRRLMERALDARPLSQVLSARLVATSRESAPPAPPRS